MRRDGTAYKELQPFAAAARVMQVITQVEMLVGVGNAVLAEEDCAAVPRAAARTARATLLVKSMAEDAAAGGADGDRGRCATPCLWRFIYS